MLKGSIVALVTPMTGAGDIDYPALGGLLDFHLQSGTDAVVIAGTTGESATLDSDEYRQLLAFAVDRVGGRMPVLAGTGGPATAYTVKQTRIAAELGADAALVVTPYYNRPPQQGLVQHYRAVARGARIPIVLYNVPARTGVDMTVDTVSELASCDEIIAIKEANAESGRIAELVDRVGDRMLVLSGDDPTAAQAMLDGAAGVISVVANVVPDLMHRLCELACAGDSAAAETLDQRLEPLYTALAVQANPIPVKWSLQAMGKIGAGIRLPLTGLDERHHDQVNEVLRSLQLVKK